VKNVSKKAEESLNTAAGILASEVLKMVKRVLRKEESCEADPRLLKEVGAAVKEAVSVVTALGKNEPDGDEGIRIVFGFDEEVMK
jgi:hypothetical protein